MSYLFPFIYLFLNSMTRIVVEGREVLIQKTSSQSWKVSTPIFEGRGEFPHRNSRMLAIGSADEMGKYRKSRSRCCARNDPLDSADPSSEFRERVPVVS